MYNEQELGISKQELQYISEDKSYEVYFEQISYNLFKIRSIGYLNSEYISKLEIIFTNILNKLNELRPKQKIFFINDISKIKKPKLELINSVVFKIKQFSNIGGMLVVGNTPLIKLAFLTSSHIEKNFFIKFFNSEQEALDYHNQFLSINFQFIDKHFKKFDNKYTITFQFPNSTSKFYMEFDGSDIIMTKPLGVADNIGISLAFQKFDNEIYPEILSGKPYYRIHDFTNYETSSGNASTVFIKWVKEHLHEMHLLIFCGLNKKNSAIIKLGKFLFKDRKKIHIVDTIEDAYSLISRHKNKNEKFDKDKNEDDKLVLPESKQELQAVIKYLIEENKSLKNIISDSSEKLFDLFSELTWAERIEKDIDFNEKEIPEPFDRLIETVKIIHKDLQDLIHSRNEEHKRSALLEERYRKIMQVMPKIAIRGYNKDLEIFFWNDSGEDIFGISTNEAIGKNLRDIYICKDCIEIIEKSVNDAVINKLTGEFLKPRQQVLLDKNNKKIVIYTIHTTLFDNEGEQIFFSLDFDLTKQYEIEEELRNHKENLEDLVKEKTFELEIEKDKAQESDRLKSAFLANMSHEIRSPMNTIIGFSDLLENNDLSLGKRLKYVNLIKTSGNNLMNIINDIVDVSKMEVGKISLKREIFDLCQVIESIKKEYLPQIEKIPEIEFKIRNCEDKDELIIFSDTPRIKQIITNLLNNAIKFTHKGFIELSYKITESNKINICVKDTGIGLSEEQKEYIFSSFRQADENISREYGGTGLGLTISKNLAELLGGDIFVESELNQGSNFILELPYNKEIIKTETKNTVIETNIGNIETKKLLLVEDDLPSALLMTEILEEKGVIVTHCKTGQEALKQFEVENDFDIILLDIQLPDINGYEIIKQIRKTNKIIPIIAQTAFAMLNEKEQILNSGFNDYLSKPIKKDMLFMLLEQYLIKQNQ